MLQLRTHLGLGSCFQNPLASRCGYGSRWWQKFMPTALWQEMHLRLLVTQAHVRCIFGTETCLLSNRSHELAASWKNSTNFVFVDVNSRCQCCNNLYGKILGKFAWFYSFFYHFEFKCLIYCSAVVSIIHHVWLEE